MRWPFRGAIDLLLLAGLAVGLYLTSRASTELSSLRRQHRGLAEEVGTLTIGDAEKIHVVRVPSDDPLHWKWRVYVPAHLELTWLGAAGRIAPSGPRAETSGKGWSRNDASPTPREFLIEAKVFDRNGDPSLRQIRPGGTGSISLPREFLPLQAELGERITVGVAGDGQTEQYAANEPAYLLRMRLGDEDRPSERSVAPELAPGLFLAIVPQDVFPQFEREMEGEPE